MQLFPYLNTKFTLFTLLAVFDSLNKCGVVRAKGYFLAKGRARSFPKSGAINDKTERRGNSMAENDDVRGGFLGGFLIGSLIGALAGLLFAPKSGKELRSELKQKGSEVFDEANELYSEAQARAKIILEEAHRRAEELKKEANLQLAEARLKAKEVIGEAKAGVKKVKGAVEAGLEAAKQELSEEQRKDEPKA
jgi:gas vesicle protein